MFFFYVFSFVQGIALLELFVCYLITIILSELNVMANYKPDLSCQSKFIPVDFSQQITPGTFEKSIKDIQVKITINRILKTQLS